MIYFSRCLNRTLNVALRLSGVSWDSLYFAPCCAQLSVTPCPRPSELQLIPPSDQAVFTAFVATFRDGRKPASAVANKTWNHLLPLTVKAAAVVQFLGKLTREQGRLANLERCSYLHDEAGRWTISAAFLFATMLWQRTHTDKPTHTCTHMHACLHKHIHTQKDAAKWSDNPHVCGGGVGGLRQWLDIMKKYLCGSWCSVEFKANNSITISQRNSSCVCVCVFPCVWRALVYVTAIRFWSKPPQTQTKLWNIWGENKHKQQKQEKNKKTYSGWMCVYACVCLNV